MSYDIIAIPQFKKELKKLSKKYPSLKDEFSKLIDSLEQDPEQGVALGKNCYKVRLAIASKGKGKSGGARVITHIVIAETTVYLMTIYDKADKETLSDKELKELLDSLPD